MTAVTLAAILDVEHLVRVSGYPLLFVLVMAESSGMPIPGETALIAASVLASQDTLQIELVIAIAAAAAIVGDNIGYLIGRKGGRWLLERPGPLHYQRLQVLATGQPFFERHGPKAVFFGRFVLGLRVWASWLAGATNMPWRSFLLWNALGGITWAVVIGTIAYLLGNSASSALETFGVWGLVAVIIAIAAFVVWHLRTRNRPLPPPPPPPGGSREAAAGIHGQDRQDARGGGDGPPGADTQDRDADSPDDDTQDGHRADPHEGAGRRLAGD
ncbi:MAG TPA: DedA family protein [Solirubrobacteraceae bacterium]|nr:DedA family protein [Solirubrobacteraceae bacterium]